MASEQNAQPGRIIAQLARHLDMALAGLDLTIAQYRVLGILGDGREAASVLAEKLAVSRPSVTGVVDGLVARGLVRRDHAGDDRRRIDIDLTDEGRLVLASADLEVERRLTSIAEHLDAGADTAFAALVPWDDAMRACRQSKRRSAQRSDSAAPASNVAPTTEAVA